MRQAPGSFSEFLGMAKLKETKGSAELKAEVMIKELMKDNEYLVGQLRELASLAESYSDQPTLDLLTNRLQVHEKTIWMLKSVLT